MTPTTTPVDLDRVLAVAGELRRLCQREVNVGVSFSTFKQGQPSIRSDGPFYRLLAYCPRTWGYLVLIQLWAVDNAISPAHVGLPSTFHTPW